MNKFSRLTYRGSYALVTGASKGLGKVFADVLAARGMNVVLVARSRDLLSAYAQSLSEKYGIRAVAIGADLASPHAPFDIQTALASQSIEIDLLINNAGFGLSGSFLSHDLEQEEKQIQVNVQALTALTHILGNSMAARGRGGIINLASNSSFQPLPYMAGYAATKAFVLISARRSNTSSQQKACTSWPPAQARRPRVSSRGLRPTCRLATSTARCPS